MKVFISWSGEIGQLFAASLADWLPNVIQAVEPFFSSDDIRKGTGWLAKVSSELDQSNFGILCVTPDNKNAPWLLFEAGALAKRIQHTHVCPLLLGINAAQLEGPLAQFQATGATREEMRKLLASINDSLGEKALNETLLSNAFNRNWNDLEAAIKKATDTITEKQKNTGIPKQRNADDMLEEILNVTRGIGRQLEENRIEALSGPGSAWPGFPPPNPAAMGLSDEFLKAFAPRYNAGYGVTPHKMRASTLLGTATEHDSANPITPAPTSGSPTENKKK